jgi:hypothetical protein
MARHERLGIAAALSVLLLSGCTSGKPHPTPTAIESPTVAPTSTPVPTPSPSPALAAWISRSIRTGPVGAIALATSAIYIIYEKSQPAGSYSPALARVAMINRSTGELHDGGAFPGAESLALAGGYLWVASGVSPGVNASDSNVLYRMNASSLVVQQRTSLGSLVSTGNYEPPVLAGNGSRLWVGYGVHVARLDVITGAVLHTSTVGNAGAGVSSLAIDPLGRVLYVGMAGDCVTGASVAELNSTTGIRIAMTSTYYGCDLGGPKLAATGDGVWVAYATGLEGSAAELRASDLEQAAIIPGLHSNGIEAFTGGGVLWLADGMAGELFCSDPATGAPRASVSWPLGGLVAADARGAFLGGYAGVSFLRPDPRCQAA